MARSAAVLIRSVVHQGAGLWLGTRKPPLMMDSGAEFYAGSVLTCGGPGPSARMLHRGLV